MSNLVVSNISDGTTSVGTGYVVNGSVKAWVNFNSSGPTIRGSFNIASITDNGVGDFTLNFINSMSDGNYSASGLLGLANDAGAYNPLSIDTDNRTASSCRVDTENSASAQSDAVSNDAQIHGDLA